MIRLKISSPSPVLMLIDLLTWPHTRLVVNLCANWPLLNTVCTPNIKNIRVQWLESTSCLVPLSQLRLLQSYTTLALRQKTSPTPTLYVTLEI